MCWHGRIAREGGKELALELEEKGYGLINEIQGSGLLHRRTRYGY
jgi:Fe-S cluster assembly ATPase SufC